MRLFDAQSYVYIYNILNKIWSCLLIAFFFMHTILGYCGFYTMLRTIQHREQRQCTQQERSWQIKVNVIIITRVHN